MSKSLSSFFKPHHVAFRILVVNRGLNLGHPSELVLSPNHWTGKEFPSYS